MGKNGCLPINPPQPGVFENAESQPVILPVNYGARALPCLSSPTIIHQRGRRAASTSSQAERDSWVVLSSGPIVFLDQRDLQWRPESAQLVYSAIQKPLFNASS